MNAINQYLKDISQYPLLTPVEERELMIWVIRGRTTRSDNVKQKALAARQRLIVCNQRLVVSIANAYAERNPQLDLLDLINEGNVGLMHAIDNKFEYGRGANKLSTYVVRWIKQRMHRHIEEQRVVAVPEHLVSLRSRYQEAMATITHRTGQLNPDKKLIAQHMGEDEKRIGHLELAMRKCTSIDQVAQEDSQSLNQFLDDGDLPTVETETDNKQIRRLIVKHLFPREAFIILARFDINCPNRLLKVLARKAGQSFDRDYFIRKWQELGKINRPRFGGYTLEEIGEVLNITKERVRQIELKAKNKLRRHLKAFDPTKN